MARKYEYIFCYKKGDPEVVHEEEWESPPIIRWEHFCSVIGKLSEGEAEGILEQLCDIAHEKGFLPNDNRERGEYIGGNFAETSKIEMIRRRDLTDSGRDRSIILRSCDRFRESLETNSEFAENDPYSLAIEALTLAEAVMQNRSQARPLPSNTEVQERWLSRMDRVLGTMVHVLMMLCSIDEDEAINRIRSIQGLKPELSDRDFGARDEIDRYTDFRSFLRDNMPPLKKDVSRVLDLLRAAVVAVQCCRLNNIQPRQVIQAFGITAYKQAARLKTELLEE